MTTTKVTFLGHIIHGNVATLVIIFILVFIFLYGLPALYNFWKLFEKAKQPAWAVLIPFYGPIIACRIAKKQIWLAIVFGFAAIQVSGPSNSIYVINAVQLVVLAALGYIILKGMSKQYKAPRSFWILSVILPIAASNMVQSVTYKPKKQKRA